VNSFRRFLYPKFLYLGIIIIIIFTFWISEENDKQIKIINTNIDKIDKKFEKINANYLKSTINISKISSETYDTIPTINKIESLYESDSKNTKIIEELNNRLEESYSIINEYRERLLETEEKIDSILYKKDSINPALRINHISEECNILYKGDSAVELSANDWENHIILYVAKINFTLCIDTSNNRITRSDISIKDVRINKYNNRERYIVSGKFYCPDSFETMDKIMSNDSISIGFRSIFTKSRSNCQSPYIYIYFKGKLKNDHIAGTLFWNKTMEDPSKRNKEYYLNFKIQLKPQ
jgi:hypothetical protein